MSNADTRLGTAAVCGVLYRVHLSFGFVCHALCFGFLDLGVGFGSSDFVLKSCDLVGKLTLGLHDVNLRFMLLVTCNLHRLAKTQGQGCFSKQLAIVASVTPASVVTISGPDSSGVSLRR